MILPGSTIGILGSGQLGRMAALAARELGYRVQVYSPDYDSPTGHIADREWAAPYDDLDEIRRFAEAVDVVTFEFENIPTATVEALAANVPVHPGGWVLHTAQNRLREKAFLTDAGLPVAPHAAVTSLAELRAALAQIGTPAVLKSASFGYDGKGQVKLHAPDEAEAAWDAIGQQPAVLEAFVPFERELSVVAVRGADGAFAAYPPIQNHHERHILDLSLCPAPLPAALADRAIDLARTVLETLNVVGVLCVEMFLTAEGELLVNEVAPRPHNSGHLTIDACTASQFEQQVRAVCGLPLGDTTLHGPAAMANLLGDLWQGGEPNWAAALAVPGVALHLYGKREARVGRKMGHLTALGATLDEARERVLAARFRLTDEGIRR